MLSADCHRQNGVTLVSVTLTNDGPRRRVRIESRLSPVWPPREAGVPEAGWDGPVYECVLAPGETRGFGFATPATPSESPVELREMVPADDSRQEPDVAAVLRRLGDPRPPRDAVPEGRP
jgi:hypothetical protein